MLLSVIIPVYNERKTLTEILQKVEAVPLKKEIILIDDGSTDGTQQLMRDLKKENIKVIFHEKNQGKGAAIKTGLKEATGEVIIIQDADLEYDPMDYLKLMAILQAGKAQVVYGSRILGSNERSYHRYYLGGRLLTFLTNCLYGIHITDEPTCYKMFRKEVIDRIKLDCQGFEFCSEVTAKVARLGYPIYETPISYHPRSFEQGKKIKFRDGLIGVWTLLKYRFLPRSKMIQSVQ